MSRRKKPHNKLIDFDGKKLVVYSPFATHPVTGILLEQIERYIDFGFIDRYAPGTSPLGRPPLPFRAKCKMLCVLFCERITSLSELARRLARDDRLREFCGFKKHRTPSKQTISRFLIALPERVQYAMFSELHAQLQRVEYVENNTVSVDACVYRTVNKLPDREKVEKRNNETGRMKKVYGIKQTTAVLAQRGVCSGFVTDPAGHHESLFYEDVLDMTVGNGYRIPCTAADKAFDSNELRWNTLLNYGAEAVIPKRVYGKTDSEQKAYKRRRRSLAKFATPKEQRVYNDRTAVERYYAKTEWTLGLSRLRTRNENASASLLAFVNMFDVMCRTVHLYETLENAIVPL